MAELFGDDDDDVWGEEVRSKGNVKKMGRQKKRRGKGTNERKKELSFAEFINDALQ